MLLLKSPVSPSKCPVAIDAALAVVKVGNSEWLLAKLTPWSRTSAMAGAAVASTDPARNPSGTNSTTLCRSAAAAAIGTSITAASTMRRIISPSLETGRSRLAGAACRFCDEGLQRRWKRRIAVATAMPGRPVR